MGLVIGMNKLLDYMEDGTYQQFNNLLQQPKRNFERLQEVYPARY